MRRLSIFCTIWSIVVSTQMLSRPLWRRWRTNSIWPSSLALRLSALVLWWFILFVCSAMPHVCQSRNSVVLFLQIHHYHDFVAQTHIGSNFPHIVVEIATSRSIWISRMLSASDLYGCRNVHTFVFLSVRINYWTLHFSCILQCLSLHSMISFK